MAIGLDQLVRSIHPEVTVDRFEREASTAALRMPPLPHPPRDARELLLRLAVLQHRLSKPVGDRTPFPAYSFEGYAKQVAGSLQELYGTQGIGKAVQSIQLKGASGYREITDHLIRRHAKQRTDQVVRQRVNHFWARQDPQGKVLASKFYLARFAGLLAPDQRRRDPGQLAAVLPQVLYAHPYRLRNILGTEWLRH